jgi:hypothetical protein
MMFQGAKNASEEYFTYAERAGANLFEGGVNGTTSQDRTNYFATVPSANLENVLWFESDRLATLLDALDHGLENEPYGRWYQLMGENLFPAGHPYSWPVIGSHEDLTAASLEDVKEFFRRYYTPNNLSLVIAAARAARGLRDRGRRRPREDRGRPARAEPGRGGRPRRRGQPREVGPTAAPAPAAAGCRGSGPATTSAG